MKYYGELTKLTDIVFFHIDYNEMIAWIDENDNSSSNSNNILDKYMDPLKDDIKVFLIIRYAESNKVLKNGEFGLDDDLVMKYLNKYKIEFVIQLNDMENQNRDMGSMNKEIDEKIDEMTRSFK